jgi:hypothetical protein
MKMITASVPFGADSCNCRTIQRAPLWRGDGRLKLRVVLVVLGYMPQNITTGDAALPQLTTLSTIC